MATVPPALVYLTIYNPTLKPEGPVAPNDEDAEEQAHILFYTARERAVSRDRMLRQIGLAKALVNFSSIFSADEACSNVHSQSRRMIVVSPEPNFYIHACLEVAKTPRVRTSKKTAEKGKQPADKETPIAEAWYYQEGSINDVALRTHLQTGYESFKLTHGTFTSILSNLGHQALELQLERFFTVWAWKWDVEDGFEFASLMGIPLHPKMNVLQPALDAIASQLEDDDVAIVMKPPYLLPSSRYTDAKIPSSFPRHILSLLPSAPRLPPPHRRMSSSKSLTMRPLVSRTWTGVTAESVSTPAAEVSAKQAETAPAGGQAFSSRFLAMPSMNLSMEVMDVRKWNWGALTFKGAGRKPQVVEQAQDAPPEKASDINPAGATSNAEPAEEDSTTPHASSAEATPKTEESEQSSGLEDQSVKDGTTSSAVASPVGTPHTEADLADALESDMSFESDVLAAASVVENMEAEEKETGPDAPPSLRVTGPEPDPAPVPTEPLPPISTTFVWLGEHDNQLAKKRRVLYLTKEGFTFVVLRSDNEDIDEQRRTDLAGLAVSLVGTLANIVRAQDENSTPDDIPSAANILNPKDQHLVLRSDGVTRDGQGFVSKSEHLFDVRQMLQQNPHMLEVFSRSQQPQHWHIARRREGQGEGDVYLEVMRKETSLPDVDNVLASIARS